MARCEYIQLKCSVVFFYTAVLMWSDAMSWLCVVVVSADTVMCDVMLKAVWWHDAKRRCDDVEWHDYVMILAFCNLM